MASFNVFSFASTVAFVLVCGALRFVSAANDCPPDQKLAPAPDGCRYQEIVNTNNCRIVLPIPICGDNMGRTPAQRAQDACTMFSCKTDETCTNGVCAPKDPCSMLRCSNGCRNGQCVDAAYTQTTSQIRNNVCSSMVCGECERCVVNGVGVGKCIYAEGCCATTSRLNACFVDPCLDFRRSCSAAMHCVSVTCDGCSAKFYDREFNLLAPTTCSSNTVQRFSSRISLPQYKAEYSAIKPGLCPMASSSWMITVCSQECSSDNECPGMNKCCVDGCTRRCAQPITDGTNYLSFPITVRVRDTYEVDRHQKH